MPVPPQDVVQGKCFVTSAGQVRRVLDVINGGNDVVYEARGKKNIPQPWPDRKTVDKNKFADAVDKEVRCDHDPDCGQQIFK